MKKEKLKKTPEKKEAGSSDKNEQSIELQQLGAVYHQFLDVEMEKLHNAFVSFIAEARLPLPQVLLVLEMIRSETIRQARVKYLGG